MLKKYKRLSIFAHLPIYRIIIFSSSFFFNMVRPIPTEVQNSIKLSLIEGLSYSAIHKMYPNVELGTLSWYKRKFLGDSTSPKGGKQSKISTQTRK